MRKQTKTKRYELFETHLDDSTQTIDIDLDLQALIGRNFTKIAFDGGLNIDLWIGEENHGAVDLKFWVLDYLLMESGLYSTELREHLQESYSEYDGDEEE